MRGRRKESLAMRTAVSWTSDVLGRRPEVEDIVKHVASVDNSKITNTSNIPFNTLNLKCCICAWIIIRMVYAPGLPRLVNIKRSECLKL